MKLPNATAITVLKNLFLQIKLYAMS